MNISRLYTFILFHLFEICAGFTISSSAFVLNTCRRKAHFVQPNFSGPLPPLTNFGKQRFQESRQKNSKCTRFCGDRQFAADSLSYINTTNSDDDCSELSQRKGSPELPQHIAIIMDGNRRYAKSIHMPPEYGHLKGKETLELVVRYVFCTSDCTQ
jgi:hypothetical protein